MSSILLWTGLTLIVAVSMFVKDGLVLVAGGIIMIVGLIIMWLDWINANRKR